MTKGFCTSTGMTWQHFFTDEQHLICVKAVKPEIVEKKGRKETLANNEDVISFYRISRICTNCLYNICLAEEDITEEPSHEPQLATEICSVYKNKKKKINLGSRSMKPCQSNQTCLLSTGAEHQAPTSGVSNSVYAGVTGGRVWVSLGPHQGLGLTVFYIMLY